MTKIKSRSHWKLFDVLQVCASVCVPVSVCVSVRVLNYLSIFQICKELFWKGARNKANIERKLLLTFCCYFSVLFSLLLLLFLDSFQYAVYFCCCAAYCVCHSLCYSFSLSLFTLILKHDQTRRLSKCLGPQKSMLRNFKVKCFPWILKCLLRVLVNIRQEEDTEHRHAWIHTHIGVHASTCCQLIHKQSYRFRNRQTSLCVVRWRRAVTNSKAGKHTDEQ